MSELPACVTQAPLITFASEDYSKSVLTYDEGDTLYVKRSYRDIGGGAPKICHIVGIFLVNERLCPRL